MRTQYQGRRFVAWSALLGLITQPWEVIGAPAGTGETQIVLQAPNGVSKGQHPDSAPSRRLSGRFLHITDIHPDKFYQVHSSTEESVACHRGKGPAGTYGAETSDCDSPFTLANATIDWISDNLVDEIDFVIWTGDSARHDSDEKLPRDNDEILETNRMIADHFAESFTRKHNIPVVPTFGNNDIYPHNILMPGPNDILRSYTDIWREFIPEAQRHQFEFGGWFSVEVIPNQLTVFSLNTMYFFDRNAGIDDCVKPSEPGYKHFEWLRIQLQFLRKRGMKAILIGHVPPARTEGKQLWDETCWQKYTLWLEQYRDVIVGSLYGHMNIDHFMLQDTHDVDLAIVEGTAHPEAFDFREAMEDDLTVQSSADYLVELRHEWSGLPDPAIKEVEDSRKKHKKHKKNKHKKIGGPWAERYQLSFVSPSVVPNYLPTIRVFDYNITGLEDAPTWADAQLARSHDFPPIFALDDGEIWDEEEQESAWLEPDESVMGKHKKKKKKGGKKKDGNLHVPKGPSKSSPPGPAYSAQPLTFTSWTQYFANLTYINNDIAADAVSGSDISLDGWDPGKHDGKKPKNKKPKPLQFNYEVEYSTTTDKIYKLKDLTVRSFLDLAHRIGKAKVKSNSALEGYEPGSQEYEIDTYTDESADNADSEDDELDDDDDYDDDQIDADTEDGVGIDKKKHKHKKHKHKNTKIWLHFLQHAFVRTKSKDELKKLGK